MSFLVWHVLIGVISSAYCIHVNLIIYTVQMNGLAYVKRINIYLITRLVWYAFYRFLTTYLNMSLDPADY